MACITLILLLLELVSQRVNLRVVLILDPLELQLLLRPAIQTLCCCQAHRSQALFFMLQAWLWIKSRAIKGRRVGLWEAHSLVIGFLAFQDELLRIDSAPLLLQSADAPLKLRILRLQGTNLFPCCLLENGARKRCLRQRIQKGVSDCEDGGKGSETTSVSMRRRAASTLFRSSSSLRVCSSSTRFLSLSSLRIRSSSSRTRSSSSRTRSSSALFSSSGDGSAGASYTHFLHRDNA
jgi:hypothetical protein